MAAMVVIVAFPMPARGKASGISHSTEIKTVVLCDFPVCPCGRAFRSHSTKYHRGDTGSARGRPTFGWNHRDYLKVLIILQGSKEVLDNGYY